MKIIIFADRYSIEENGPAITVIAFVMGGTKISIDFTIVIPLKRPDRVEWPYNSSWPDTELVSKVLNCNINLVAKKNYEYEVSFNELEKQLSLFADTDDHGIRKKCHRLMKSFDKKFWSLDDNKPFIDSYRLKVNIML